MVGLKSKRYGAAVDIDALKKALPNTGAVLVELASIMNDQRKYVESLEARVRDLERAKRHTGGQK